MKTKLFIIILFIFIFNFMIFSTENYTDKSGQLELIKKIFSDKIFLNIFYDKIKNYYFWKETIFLYGENNYFQVQFILNYKDKIIKLIVSYDLNKDKIIDKIFIEE